MNNNFIVYSSSAGSGKTFTLTKEYIQLALQNHNGQFNPFYFKHILAITFTNDAANEMRKRILDTLMAISKQDHVLLDTLKELTGLTQNELAERAGMVFYKIIYNYSDFAIGTIDSFINRVIQAFAKELNLPFFYEIDLDNKILLDETINNVISKVEEKAESIEQKTITEIMLNYAIELNDNQKNWNRIHDELLQFSEHIFFEKSFSHLEQLKKIPIKKFIDHKKDLLDYKNKIDQAISDAAYKGHQLIINNGLSEEDFLGGKNGSVAKYFERLTKNINFNPLNSYVQKAVLEDQWYKKGSNNPMIDAIKDELKELITSIEAIKEKESSFYAIAQSILIHINQISLLAEIKTELEKIKQEKQIVPIAEINQKISRIIQNEPIPFIYEKVGEKYHHLLIDEFQDTSVLQWKNLLPLVENSLINGHLSMIVGDTKQSIYRWRGGEMQQLHYLAKADIEPLTENENKNSIHTERLQSIRAYINKQNLTTNFRSTKEIITFNNHFFTFLADLYLYEYPLLHEIYKECTQKIPVNAPAGGGISFTFKDKETYNEDSFLEIEARITQSLKDGFSWKDIAILCRKNSHAKEIATFLKEKNYPIISKDSILLTSNEGIQFLTALLQLIHFSGNVMVKYEAAFLFFKHLKKKLPDREELIQIHELAQADSIAFFEFTAHHGFTFDLKKALALPLYELSNYIIASFRLFAHNTNTHFLFRFLDYLLEFSRKNNNYLGAFIRHWNEHKHKVTINAIGDVNAIQILTIHRAKGLEFPVVILPFADWSLEPNLYDTLWADLKHLKIKEKNHPELLPASLIYTGRKLFEDPLIQKQQLEEKEKILIEHINTLYVAFTRPTHRLHVIGKKEPGKKQNISRWIKLYLEQLEDENQWKEEKDDYQFHNLMPYKEKIEKNENNILIINDIKPIAPIQ